MKNLLNNLLYGRNGIDQLGLFTIWVYIIISIINLFTYSLIGDLSALLLMVLIFFRMLSKNIIARNKENNIYKKITGVFTKPFANLKLLAAFMLSATASPKRCWYCSPSRPSCDGA